MLLDVPYSQPPVPLRSLDLYAPQDSASGAPPPLFVFVHGGAWRSGDKHELDALAQGVVKRTGFAVALPNYRLSPREPTPGRDLYHPAHCEDILEALEALYKYELPVENIRGLYDASQIHLGGHSCGAHMLSSIFLDSSAVTPSLRPSDGLLSSVQSITVSEGLYDLDLLLNTFPGYRDFVSGAFGELASYKQFSTTGYKELKAGIRWLVIHSKGDELVDMAQSWAIYEALTSRGARVAREFERLDGKHNDVFGEAEYAQIASRRDVGSSISRQDQAREVSVQG
ncbi:alpha/beta-hydrolase [Sistotremastrum niveocremeum HHB9708]|uniref:Alpha/beta-hydrolase n=1 Tax=Sistotremastrum niveocremeum HHB9708 TaxID=1314777 RepID=A0A165AIK9_9AGAM|nr:alpha/beta-hydrolase [Sistotremastrum niveocremeum HHB9708]